MVGSPPPTAVGIALWAMGVVALFVWLRSGIAWPALVVQRIEHCGQPACDFAEAYLPQVRQLFDGPLHHLWIYPPLGAILLLPFAALSVRHAVAVWTAVQIALAL